jgi:hypothetical protein
MKKIKSHFSTSGGVKERTIPEGYPDYPENEDIYNRFKKARSIDPEDITTYREKEVNEVFIYDDFNEFVSTTEDSILRSESEENEEIALAEADEDVNFSFQGDDIIDPIENLQY